jgi:hypothetical protein
MREPQNGKSSGRKGILNGLLCKADSTVVRNKIRPETFEIKELCRAITKQKKAFKTSPAFSKQPPKHHVI